MDKLSAKEVMEDYYNLKKQYDTQLINAKRAIIRDKTKGKPAKLRSLAAMKTKCINCRKIGGTIFTETLEGIKIKARCGAKTPCALNIEVYRGNYLKINYMYQALFKEAEKIKTNIIKTKLNMLFDFMSEEETMTEFTNLKKWYDKLIDTLNTLDAVIENVVHNKRNEEALDKVTKKTLMEIDNIKELYKNYITMENSGIILDIVSTYTEDLYPAVTKLRELTYAKNAIECDSGITGPRACEDDVYYLIQDPYTYEDMEYIMDDMEVIAYSK
jgi:hypothetical protein